MNSNRKNPLKYIQIFKTRKAFKRAQQEEEDCNREAIHSLPDFIKHTSTRGTLNNPFSSIIISEQKVEAARSMQADINELSKKSGLNIDNRSLSTAALTIATTSDLHKSLRIP